MTGSEDRLLYEFSGFRLDPLQRLLSGADGRPIPMSPRVLDTLLYFLERRGELLDKSTLMKAIWPNVVVEENSLNQNIAAIRRALGERPREHRFIVTEPGRGYRFVADVRVVTVPPAGAPEPERPGSRTAASPRAASRAVPRRSIAVLPFANLTGDATKDYLGDGLADELIHTLARVPGLRVPSRTSSFAYKGHNVDLRDIACDLQVDTVLEGSVRSAGERIRITAQLIDGETGFHLWSQHYDRRFEGLFELQDELATAIIVETLNVTLQASAQNALRGRTTRDLEAYQLYLQAMAISVEPASIPRAVEMLEQAIERDPGFTRARSLIASLRAISLLVLDVSLPGSLADTEREALAALATDAEAGSVHASLGIIQAAQGRWLAAEGSFQAALSLDDDPYTQYSYGLHLLGSVGHLRRYLSTAVESHRLAPAWLPNFLNLAVAHALVGLDEDAREYANTGVDLGLAKTAPPIVDVLAQLAVRAGRYEEAQTLMVDAMAMFIRSSRGIDAVRRLFAALAEPHSRPAAITALDALYNEVDSSGLSQMMRRRMLVWYALLGAYEQAYAITNRSFDDFASHGTVGTAWSFLWLPELAGFREDPRFTGLVSRMKLPDDWQRYGPPDDYDWRDGRLIRR